MRAVAWAMRRAGLRNVQELQIVFQSHEITLVMTQLLTIKNRISSVIIGGGGWGGGAPPSVQIAQGAAYAELWDLEHLL
jgi:hypothetical protein